MRAKAASGNAGAVFFIDLMEGLNMQMEKMKDMKQSKKEAKKGYYDMPTTGDKPMKYPYGLTLDLDTATIKKLGLGDCEVGEVLKVYAQVCVTEKSEREYEGKGAEATMTLQVEKMSVMGKGANEGEKYAKKRNEEEYGKR